MSTLTWTIGRGLLGSQIAARVALDWTNAPRIPWGDENRAREAIDAAVTEFFRACHIGRHRWAIVWSAGAGVIGTPLADLQRETAALAYLLERLEARLRTGDTGPGTFFHASSAGGVYGGNVGDTFIDESTAVAPISDYGRNKLAQEELVRALAERRTAARAVIGRIATLYGAGQDFTKTQGLIAHFCRASILRQPLNIYVPLDTMRDYLLAKDCAIEVLRTTDAVAESADAPPCLTKVFASEQPATVAQIVDTFKRLGHHAPLVLCRPSALALQQGRRLAFRSQTWRHVNYPRKAHVGVGIPQVYRDIFGLYVAGRFAPASAGGNR